MSENTEEMQRAQVTQPAFTREGLEASLGIQDLMLMVNVLEEVSKRGAIRPGEMQTVGTLYSKLVEFLTANGAIQPNQDTQEDKV